MTCYAGRNARLWPKSSETRQFYGEKAQKTLKMAKRGT